MGLSGGLSTNGGGPLVTRESVRLAARGLLMETYDLTAARDIPTATATTGTAFVVLVGLLAGDLISNLVCLCQTSAGSGLTLAKMGLWSSAGTLLRATADFHSTLTTSFNDNALTSPYQIPTTGGYYIGFVAVGTTGPSLVRSVATAAISGASLNSGALLTGSAATQTDAANITIVSGAGTGFYFAAH